MEVTVRDWPTHMARSSETIEPDIRPGGSRSRRGERWDIRAAGPLVEPKKKKQGRADEKGCYMTAPMRPRGKDVTKAPSTPTPLRCCIPLAGSRQYGLGVIQRCRFSSSGQMGRKPTLASGCNSALGNW